MKSVLISIQPIWCELIASGKKTVEVRKTRPKIDTPFKCYIYCTKDKHGWFDFLKKERLDGKVIGEFVCDAIVADKTFGHDTLFKTSACMSDADIAAYCLNKEMYGWHISDIVIYDEPKELSDSFSACNKPQGTDCSKCIDAREVECKALKRPPQSWCYVEEI